MNRNSPHTGDARTHYRLRKTESKGRYVPIRSVNQAVTKQILGDMRSKRFIKALTCEARKYCEAHDDNPAKDFREEIAALNHRISKTMDLATDLDDPGPALRKINELEMKRKILADETRRIEQEYSVQMALKGITETQVGAVLKGFADDLSSLPQNKWKEAVRRLVDQVVLDPDSLNFQIHYRIPVENRLCMASPRGGHLIPQLHVNSHVPYLR